jgi:dephospho-CoA kinase
VGLTGSFGSGKTTVARIFMSLNAKIIDADKIAHKAMRPKTRIYKKIVNTFGKGILNKERTINRNKLAQIVFNNKQMLNRLNKIMHPEIIRIMRQRLKRIRKGIIILDAPLLIETGLERMVDKLIVVKITPEKQIERIRRKTGLDKIDILRRIAVQIPLSNKLRLADFVIDNSGTVGETKKQILEIRRLLWKS